VNGRKHLAADLALAFVTRYSGTDVTLGLALTQTGGVMGTMIDAQSIVVSATATGVHRQEGVILRRVFAHSLAFAWMVP